MKKICIMLCLFIIIAPAAVLPAETPEPVASTQPSSITDVASTEGTSSGPSGDAKKNFRLEISGNYNSLDSGYGQWKVLDLRLRYSGFEKTTPFGSISTQHRKEGSQWNYALGSYIHVNPRFYMIAGVSVAPVRDPDVIIYPRLRMDLSGYYSTRSVEGLVLTTGITHLPKQKGNGGDIISAGCMYYYRKFIFTGALNYNIAQPGNVTSMSGQASIMYGTEGRYWVGGGTAFGRVAYQLASEIPFDVRYKSRSLYVFYNKWIGRDWGINTRLDYQHLTGAYRLKGITVAWFYDF